MLIKISINNFKSFESSTDLTMIPSNKIRKNIDHKTSVKKTPLLKSAVIYGANASGKSNLIECFQFIQHCVRCSLPLECSNMFCKNSKENDQEPSSFELQISVDDNFYAYGFSAILSERRIVTEWLYQLYQNGSSRPIFERLNNNVTPYVPLNSAEKARFSVYSEDLGEKPFILFLGMIGKGKRITDNSKLIPLQKIYNWITSNLHVITPRSGISDFKYYYNEENLKRVNKIISTFDTGITDIRIEEITVDELRRSIPKEVFEDIFHQVKQRINDRANPEKLHLSMRSETDFFSIDFTANQEPKITTLKFQHNKSFYDFDFSDESDGTRRLFDLIDILLDSTEDVVYVVDELERSLHPKLTAHFIELFSKIHEKQNVQLVFTTHEASIMDQALFRRDEIWFVERDANNSSRLYSLDQFKERYDKKLSKAYLEGRYGAIPIFSSFEFSQGEE